MTPASFLSTYCLIELAKSVEKQFPCASKVIAEDFYMDDLMTGADTEDDCCQLQREVSTVLDSAKLPLRKWCSNSEFVLQNMSKCVNDPLFVLDIGDNDTVKSLGLQWKPIADLFQFEIVSRSMEGTLTKRAILSDLNRIFDPLGFLSPVLVKGKIFLQQLWSMKIDWDARLPLNIQERWGKFYEDLERLKYLSIPRKAIPERTDIIDVHGFCDASEEAYAACIYIRSQSSDGKWHSRLLCAKPRVAPLKENTIPRLELNGALLLTELTQRVADSWQINIHQFKLWMDSTIVLGWFNSQSSRLKIYVANRVAQIMDTTEVSQWNHIGTQENPADIPSRGLRPRELLTARLWWNGPTWLESDEKDWILNPITHDDELPEVRKVKLLLLVIKPLNSILEHYFEWNCMLRRVAWLMVYSKYMRKKINGPQSLTISDSDEARKSILRMVQAECFSKEISSLERGQEVPRNSMLRSLNPFLRDGLILVGGRLENSDIADGQKHPIVLPASHKITRLIFEAYHLELLHGGPQLMLSEVRRLYWPLLGRVTARSVVWHCVKCTKARPRFNHPIMAPLPRDRVQCTRPFTVTGVDFAGPIYIRSGLRRVAAKKAWIAIFVCFSTKAIHLELADDLSSKSFMATFRYFMARRGKCAKVFSDNSTNFVGAQKELISMMKKASVDLEKEGIEWHFNPPTALHFGGIWESAVKSMKHHMKRVISDHKLTNTEMRTLLCQIEACLNSRPMTPLNSDPSDLAVLTPSHFLIGGAMLLPDEPDISKEEPNGLRRWQLVQNLMQTFWKRWSREYLPQTQIRGKWTSKSAQLAKNDVVIIKDDCMPLARWKLGLVMELHPGSDGVVRVVTIRTANGTLMRRPKLADVGYEQHLIQEQWASKDKLHLIRSMMRLRKKGTLPPVYPNGWFALLDSDQLIVNQVKYVTALAEIFDVVTGKSKKPILAKIGNETEDEARKRQIGMKHKSEHETSVPYTPEQNGRAECSMRTICEAARTMIYAKNFPKSLWAEAVNTVVFSFNYTGNSGKVCKTSYELWFDKLPKIEKFVEFGINAYSLVPKQRRKKWDTKSRKGYFVGYSETSKGYRIWYKENNEVSLSRDVIFKDESVVNDQRVECSNNLNDSNNIDVLSLHKDGSLEHSNTSEGD
ncbi:uncharacterized protein LOC132944179 [Metopolophium dirhodum]|uniref:uncharacterized protein LOC132944179 n=2 Tax=Metopolophium dirhodum TaxID=44670 RepID=UPI00298FC6FE|nr:uncharacterized protein LOC132944179 [Metopolophium dirhodum]